MSRRYTYAVCSSPGCEGWGQRHGGSHLHVYRSRDITHQWRRCPFHDRIEWCELHHYYDEVVFGWDCGTTAATESGWCLPPGVSKRAWRAIDRTRRPGHYAKYDARRGSHGRWATQPSDERKVGAGRSASPDGGSVRSE